MSADSGEKPAASMWFRLIGLQRPLWFTVAIGILLILAPLVAAYLDGLLDDLLSQGHWRLMLGPGVMITYILAVLIFFLNMRPTHRVLAAEKKQELGAIQERILVACRALVARFDTEESAGTLGAEINALVAYEKRIQETSTWPYDTAMLRTLFFSVIFPAVAAMARIAGEFLVG